VNVDNDFSADPYVVQFIGKKTTAISRGSIGTSCFFCSAATIIRQTKAVFSLFQQIVFSLSLETLLSCLVNNMFWTRKLKRFCNVKCLALANICLFVGLGFLYAQMREPGPGPVPTAECRGCGWGVKLLPPDGVENPQQTDERRYAVSYATRDIKEGERYTQGNLKGDTMLESKLPRGVICNGYLGLVGYTATRDIKKGELVMVKDVDISGEKR